jgi:hypothetical protein
VTADGKDGYAVNGILTANLLATFNVNVASRCLTDIFSVSNPSGSAPPSICGTNSGQHSKFFQNKTENPSSPYPRALY